MINPLISIIIPTYNSEKTLVSCLNSIVCQTYSAVEVLIIDGLSTDNTINIIKKYRKQYQFIQYISEKDNGIYDAMNKGIKMAKGEWLYFLGSDDYLYSTDVLQTLSLSLLAHFKIVYGNVIIGDSIEPYCGELNQVEILFKNICHQAIFYNRICFKERLFNLEFPVFADHAFNIDIICKYPNDTRFIDCIIASYGNNGISSYKTDTFESKKPDLRRKYLKTFHIQMRIKYFLYSKQMQLKPSHLRGVLLKLYKVL